MTAATATRYAIDVEDVEYLRHGGQSLLARIYKPRGAGPFPLIERSEKAPLPPVLYIQGTADVAHPVPYRDRFIANYRKAGGRVELQLFEGMGEAFITNDPHSAQARSAVEKIIEFVHREMR